MSVACLRAIAVALCATVAFAAPAWAGAPTEALRGYVDRIFAVLDDPALKAETHAASRHRALRALLDEAVDFQEAARRSLGSHWDARTPDDRSHFVRLFADVIDKAVLGRLSHDGEHMTYADETVIGADATVHARAVGKSGGDGTLVVFSMRQDATGTWRIADVSFSGMSLVGMYRAQFARIIRATSYEGLVTRLEIKTRYDGQASVGEAASKNAP